MAVLVIAEHDNAALRPGTLNTLAAAQVLGGPIDVLVAGSGCQAAASAAAAIPGVDRVRLADDAAYEHQVAEDLAPLVADLAKDYGHVLAPASTFGKNLLPRVSALMDLQMISEISGIETVQIIKYAARAIQIAEFTTDRNFEDRFLNDLQQAKSNLPAHKNGEWIYLHFIKPLVVPLEIAQ